MEKNVALYRRLPEEDRRELQGRIQVFLAEKRFEGCGGLAITEEIRLTIAAQACLLLLHRETDYYPGLYSILVYPSAYSPDGQGSGPGPGDGGRGGPAAAKRGARGRWCFPGRTCSRTRRDRRTDRTSSCTSSRTSWTTRTARRTALRCWNAVTCTRSGRGCSARRTSGSSATWSRAQGRPGRIWRDRPGGVLRRGDGVLLRAADRPAAGAAGALRKTQGVLPARSGVLENGGIRMTNQGRRAKAEYHSRLAAAAGAR